MASLSRTEPVVRVIPLPCIGMANPNLLSQALEAGAAEVAFIGCPPEDCANREGNVWLQERLARNRAPRWQGESASAPVSTCWLPPVDFGRGLRSNSVMPSSSKARVISMARSPRKLKKITLSWSTMRPTG